MRIAVVGAGAIGGIMAARLALAGHNVSVVARGAHLQAIQADGLQLVDHINNAQHTIQLPAFASARELPVQDVIVVAVKAHGLAAVLPELQGALHAHTALVPAINGLPWWYFQRLPSQASAGLQQFVGRQVKALDPDGVLQQAVDAHHVVGCVVHAAGEVRAPGQVHHTGGKRFILGELDGAMSDRLEQLSQALIDAQLQPEPVQDIRHAVWVKLIGNLSFNPTAALTGYLMNQICADEAVLDIIRPMLIEGAQVAASLGVQIGMTPDQRIDIARQLGAAKISMLQDLEAKRPMEIDAIITSVLEIAQWLNIPMPVTRMMHSLISAKARTL